MTKIFVGCLFEHPDQPDIVTEAQPNNMSWDGMQLSVCQVSGCVFTKTCLKTVIILQFCVVMLAARFSFSSD